MHPLDRCSTETARRARLAQDAPCSKDTRIRAVKNGYLYEKKTGTNDSISSTLPHPLEEVPMRALLISLLLVVLGLVVMERYVSARAAAPAQSGAPAATEPLAEGGNGMPSCPPCEA